MFTQNQSFSSQNKMFEFVVSSCNEYKIMAEFPETEIDSENNSKRNSSSTAVDAKEARSRVIENNNFNDDSNSSDFESPNQYASDDETTLREEEMLTSEADIHNELDDLQAESELPIELLLKKYGLQNQTAHLESRDASGLGSNESSSPGIEESSSSIENGDVVGPSSSKKRRVETSHEEGGSSEVSETAIRSRGEVEGTRVANDVENSATESDSGSSDDSDFVPFIPFMPAKEPRVGEEFQIDVGMAAEMPAATKQSEKSSSHYRDDLAECLWSPSVLSNVDEVEAHLRTLLRIPKSVSSVPDNCHWLNDVYKASGDLKIPLPKQAEPSSINPEFTEQDITAFETGLSEYGKNFNNIQKYFLPHKKVGDVVYFYYFWKKSERYDHFCSMYKLGRGRHLLDENITDFMFRLTNDIQSIPQHPTNTKESPFTRSQTAASGGTQNQNALSEPTNIQSRDTSTLNDVRDEYFQSSSTGLGIKSDNEATNTSTNAENSSSLSSGSKSPSPLGPSRENFLCSDNANTTNNMLVSNTKSSVVLNDVSN